MLHQKIDLILSQKSITIDDIEILQSYLKGSSIDASPSELVHEILLCVESIASWVNCDKVINFLEYCISDFNKSYIRLYKLRKQLLCKLCHLYLIKENHNEAHIVMKDIVYNALYDVAKETKSNMRYYSFRSFSDYSLADIKNETISVAHPRNFNDPLDTLLNSWIQKKITEEQDKNPIEHEYYMLMKKVAEHIKIRCMIGSIDNEGFTRSVEQLPVLMWSHYAQSHRGFCIEYDFPDSFFSVPNAKNNHVVMISPLNYMSKISFENDLDMKWGLLTKTDDWKYENEMRLISYDTECKDCYPLLHCSDAVKAIYLGVKCTDADRRRMEDAIGDKHIALYQMNIDEADFTHFKAIRIG